MPELALGLCGFWFISLFVFRTVLQFRNTGSSGIKGFHGRIGSLPWIAGLAIGLGLILAPVASLAALFGWVGGTLLLVHTPMHVAGAAFVLIGIASSLLAQLSMGDSWRVGVDESETTELVTQGLFTWVRNPIFTFMWLSMFGLVLVVPNTLALVAAALTVLGIEMQVREVEEPYLMHAHGSAYREYSSRVGRFVPGFGRLTDG